jgi:hypothetical protein
MADRETGNPAPVAGWTALIMGWIPPATIPWSVNLMLFAGWGLYSTRRYRRVRSLGVFAFLAGLTTWCFFDFADLRLGYYLWQASLLALIACGYTANREVERGGDTPAEPLCMPYVAEAPVT